MNTLNSVIFKFCTTKNLLKYTMMGPNTFGEGKNMLNKINNSETFGEARLLLVGFAWRWS